MKYDKHDTFLRALRFAREKHDGQRDDSGKNFFTAHLYPVARILMEVTDDIDIWSAGILHDTLEDTQTTLIELTLEFGPRIASLVHEVTCVYPEDGGKTFPRLKSREAMLIKYADRLSNLSRMEAWDTARQESYKAASVFWAGQADSA